MNRSVIQRRIVSRTERAPGGRALLDLYRSGRARVEATAGAVAFLRGRTGVARLPGDVAIRTAYNVLLDRDPDPVGLETLRSRMAGGMTNTEMVRTILASEEFLNKAYRELAPSVHHGRGLFVRSLPRATRILDLGGSSRNSEAGAFVLFGYPYPFEELVIVELPTGERHEHYRDVMEGDTVDTPLGPVRYRYHSMTDLSGFEDDSFDLVYSGQTIEHVEEGDADKVLAEVRRVLRPGGWFAVDTPNGAVCRLRQDEFIDPDHKVEYTHAEMLGKLSGAGLEVVRQHGLNYAGRSVAEGRFNLADTAQKWGLYDDLERCYILAYVCRAPGGG